MTQEEKSILLQDLCARLPYGFIIHRYSDNYDIVIKSNGIDEFAHFLEYSEGEDFKPYLRPMSSMTEEEKEEIAFIRDRDFQFVRKWFNDESIRETGNVCPVTCRESDYCNKKHFDYRTDDEGKTMIEKGLALEAPEGMYNTK